MINLEELAKYFNKEESYYVVRKSDGAKLIKITHQYPDMQHCIRHAEESELNGVVSYGSFQADKDV